MASDSTINRLDEALERFREVVDRFAHVVQPLERFFGFGHGSDEKFLEIIRRATLVRQLEACRATIALCDAKQPAFAVCFLRPAYEEMLWMMYLNKNKDLAAELIIAISQLATSEAFKAQADYAGHGAMFDMGFNIAMLVSLIGMHEPRREKVRELGAKLGWRRGALSPTLTGRKAEYDFLYEGTSRFVHFSPQELYRRVWGSPTELKISSNTFANYWGLFSMYWIIRIMIDTMVAVLPQISFPESENINKTIDDLLELLKGFAQVPIITAEELIWKTPEEIALSSAP